MENKSFGDMALEHERLSLEEVLAVFLTAPKREFQNGEIRNGFFQYQLAEFGLPKAKVNKLVKKHMLQKGQVTIRDQIWVFYSIDLSKVGPDK